MVVMISVLVIATLLKETTRVGYLLDGNWLYMVPVFNVVAFCFSAQYIVPEMARASPTNRKKLPKSHHGRHGADLCPAGAGAVVGDLA